MHKEIEDSELSPLKLTLNANEIPRYDVKHDWVFLSALEAWHTFATKHADNNSKLIPSQYSILFKQ